MLFNVQLDHPWEGFGLGAFLAAEALDFRGSRCRLTALDLDEEDSP
ncbi:hypothetical protein [Streptomyces sp. NPDC050164]